MPASSSGRPSTSRSTRSRRATCGRRSGPTCLRTRSTTDYVDLPWNAIQFRIEERPYTVAYLSDPANPDGARFSERLYGRFGEFFPYELTEEAPLTVRYRFWITGREDVSREEVQRHYENFAHPPEVRLQQE